MKLTALALLAAATISAQAQKTTVTKSEFGKLPDGATAELYTLTDPTLTVKLTTFGAHIVAIDAPDKAGNKSDVVLGFDTLQGFLDDKSTYMGSVVGRYGNRIGKGQFKLDGKPYQITLNNKGNMLHGGTVGFDRANWTAKQLPSGVEFTLVSPDGDQGFPGTLTAHVTYTLMGDKLKIDYAATSDKPTVVNLTNHAYFNLAGGGSILNETLMLRASKYTPVDSGLIPTGQLAPVAGTPFNFQKPTVIGERIDADNEQLKIAGGYDHNWVLKPPYSLTTPAAVVTDATTGRILKVYTTQPGVQFYTGNFLDGTLTGVNGKNYAKNTGLCLETQHYPDSPNQPSFPTTTLRPGQTMRSTTIFQFTTTK